MTSSGQGSAPGSGSDVPLRVAVESPPVAHDGESDYEILLAFSEALHEEFSYETLRDHAFTVEGGSIKKVGRVNRDLPRQGFGRLERDHRRLRRLVAMIVDASRVHCTNRQAGPHDDGNPETGT